MRSLFIGRIALASSLIMATSLSGCGQHKQITAALPSLPVISDKQTFATALDVRVTQPDIKRLLGITSKLQLVASGKFNAGSFKVGSHQLNCAPDTEFRIDLELPVDNPEILSTRLATGSLWTSKQLSIDAIPVPQTIQLGEGKVSGEVEIGRFLGVFLFNILQFSGEGSDLSKALAHMKVDNARLELRPGSQLKFGPKTVNVAEGSSVRLSGVEVDNKLDYQGDMYMDLKFARDCRWLGKRVDCNFDGGEGKVKLRARHTGKAFTLSLDKDEAHKNDGYEIILRDCSFHFGKGKKSSSLSKLCNIDLTDFKWTRFDDKREPTLELTSKMFLDGTTADIKTDVHETRAIFPGTVNALLVVQPLGEGLETHFATTGNAAARTITVQVGKKQTKLNLNLENSVIGPLSFDKQGDLNFSLQKGSAKFKKVQWTNGTSSFSLCGEGNSTLVVPSEMWLEKQPEKHTRMTLPINLAVGRGKLEIGKEDIHLGDLNGKLLFDVGQEIQLNSDLDFSIKKSPFFKDYQADVKVRGIDLTVADGKSTLSLKNCQVKVADEALIQAITREIPSAFDFNLDKTLVEDKHWRYRNATARRVVLSNLSVDKMRPMPGDKLEFNASADAELDGTVEKCGILIGKDKWQTKPFKLSGHLVGPGSVSYKFAASDKEKTRVKYALSMKLPLPEDLELDWSKVGAGLLTNTERGVILSHLKQVVVPVKHEGELDLFGESKWSKLRINNLSAKPASGGAQVQFSADAKL